MKLDNSRAFATGVSRRGFFTLVELLVVVAVIAVLASLLLPAFGSAKRLSRKTACLSNLRQCGAGTHLYAGDFAGWLVPQNANDSLSTGVVDARTTNIASMMMNCGYAPLQGIPNTYGVWKIKKDNAFSCPSLPPPSGYQPPIGTGGVGWSEASTFTVFGTRSLSGGAYYPGEIKDPSFGRLLRLESAYSRAPWLADSVFNWSTPSGETAGLGQYARLTLVNTSSPLHLRHNLKGDAWFVDGHSSSLGIGELNQIKQPTASGTLSASPLVCSVAQ